MNTNCTSLETGNCPLHSSIIYGNSQLFQFFLSDFVFLNHTNFNGLTPNDLIMDNTYFNNIFKGIIHKFLFIYFEMCFIQIFFLLFGKKRMDK